MLAQDEGLRAALGQLSGAEMKGVSVGAGEIHIAFERPDGLWRLGTGGSRWVLLKDDEPMVRDEDDEDEVRRFDRAVGHHVVAVHPGKGDAALMVALDGGWRFCIVKSPLGSAAGLPIYELLTPEHRIFALHGDGVVDGVPSDVPIPVLLKTGQLSRWPSAESPAEPVSFVRTLWRQAASKYPSLRAILKLLPRNLGR
jgi:hypothetical protein